MASGMTQSSTRNLLEWLKNICLERDNYQCIVTKLWDPVAVNPQEQCKMTGNTQLAHIIPFSMGHWGNDQKAKEIAQLWETLYLLFPDIQGLIEPTTINSPANAMTMFSPVHQDFGSFKIALIPTDTDNTYKIKTYPWHQNFCDQFYEKPITFTTHNGSELPSKFLLETHAAIAEILHASGQGEKIDELLPCILWATKPGPPCHTTAITEILHASGQAEKLYELLHDLGAIGCLASDDSTDLQNLLSLSVGALQVLGIVTIRHEVGIGYIEIQSKCYDIVETSAVTRMTT
ncbi:hypothetical protein Y699_03288 [Aspergillus fumigatus Z5]|nr:hypothetical protein Y699_03288 [Aspergillus fumigatus Z5]